jgi:hypothetical protein
VPFADPLTKTVGQTARAATDNLLSFRYRDGGNYRCDMRLHIASELEDGRVD